MGTVISFFDSLKNFATKLGTAADPVRAAQWSLNQLTKNDLDNAYRGDWIARKVVHAPAQDSTREWRAWQTSPKSIEAIENLEKIHDLKRKTRDAMIKGRLYGGGALLMGVSVGASDEELDLSKVGEGDLKFVHAMHCYELTAGPYNYDVTSPWYGQPVYYQLSIPATQQIAQTRQTAAATGVELAYSSGGTLSVHPSRVVRFLGNEFPDWRSITVASQWSDSSLQVVDDALRQTGMVVGGIASLVNDCKVDVISIPNLSAALADKESQAKLVERFTLAHQIKGINSTLIMDVEETWQRVQTNFGPMPELIRMYLLLSSGASDIPASRLVGQAPRGLQGSTSGGAMEDTRAYYDRISSEQETDVSPAIKQLDEVLLRSALGTDDPSVYYEWNPLWQMSDSEKSDIALKKAQATDVYVGSGLFNEDLLRDVISNQLGEDGTYPGWQDAVDKDGLEPATPPPPDPAVLQQMLAQKKIGPDGKPVPVAPPAPPTTPTKDAALRSRGRRKKED